MPKFNFIKVKFFPIFEDMGVIDAYLATVLSVNTLHLKYGAIWCSVDNKFVTAAQKNYIQAAIYNTGEQLMNF